MTLWQTLIEGKETRSDVDRLGREEDGEILSWRLSLCRCLKTVYLLQSRQN